MEKDLDFAFLDEWQVELEVTIELGNKLEADGLDGSLADELFSFDFGFENEEVE